MHGSPRAISPNDRPPPNFQNFPGSYKSGRLCASDGINPSLSNGAKTVHFDPFKFRVHRGSGKLWRVNCITPESIWMREIRGIESADDLWSFQFFCRFSNGCSLTFGFGVLHVCVMSFFCRWGLKPEYWSAEIKHRMRHCWICDGFTFLVTLMSAAFDCGFIIIVCACSTWWTHSVCYSLSDSWSQMNQRMYNICC